MHPSEPPETHIDDECDEDHGHSGHLSIGGAGVEIFGIAAVLFGQARQIAGFSVQSWEKKKICFLINNYNPKHHHELFNLVESAPPVIRIQLSK